MVKLTEFIRCGGCAAKIGLEDLRQITHSLTQPHYDDLLIDWHGNEDCGAFKLGDDILLQSVDVIPPVVDDAYTFGQITAANAMSDIFAKGGDVKTAMSILLWNKTHADFTEARAILEGALSKLSEAHCALVGGHSMQSPEIAFGLSVSGITRNLWRNNAARISDVIILTKPLGSGIITTAFKSGKLRFHKNHEVVKAMSELNLIPMLEARNFCVHAATDVTGFGLLGHLHEMINDDISIEIHSDEVLLFDDVARFAQDGVIPGGSLKNKEALKAHVCNTSNKNDIMYYDAQTSGGLLLALEAESAKKLNRILQDKGVRSSIIATCIPKNKHDIYLR